MGAADMDDVISLVQDVRSDLGGRLDRLSDNVARIATDHAERLTRAETRLEGHDKELEGINARLNRHGEKLGELADDAREEKSATEALKGEKKRRLLDRRWLVEIVSGAVLVVVPWGASTGWRFH